MNATRFDPADRNPLRVAVARTAVPGPPGVWLAAGIVAIGAAGLFAARSMPRPSAAAAFAAAVLLLVGVAKGGATRGAAYGSSLVDSIGDAILLAPLAWPLAHGPVRYGAAAVAASGLMFVGAYAQTRARAHGYAFTSASDGAPERCAILAAGLAVPAALLEPALWLVAALGALAAARVTVVVWTGKS